MGYLFCMLCKILNIYLLLVPGFVNVTSVEVAWAAVLSSGAKGFLSPGALAVAIHITTNTQKAKNIANTTNAKRGAIISPGKFIIHFPDSSNNADRPDSLFFK